MMTPRPDVAVIGGGVVGLAVAWRCAQRGLDVHVYHDELPGTASAVAPGMLAPVSEADFPDPALLKFAHDARVGWPAFAAELAEASGIDLGYNAGGLLLVAHADEDRSRLAAMYGFRDGYDVPCTRLDAAELRAREPMLSAESVGGGFATEDHHVDAQRVRQALRVAGEALGVRYITRRVTSLDEVTAGSVLVAAGAWSPSLHDWPGTPVQGQVVLLRDPSGGPGLRHGIRGVVGGEPVFLAGRDGSRTIVAATVDHTGFDARPSARATDSLLRKAITLVPALAGHEVIETRVGLRPDTPDHLPIMGRVPDRPGVYVSTGHYRHGVLLAPVAAELMTTLMVTGADGVPAAFTPQRFRSAKEGASR
ncbi:MULTISPECIES: glycine oxidase ThiO [Streptomyces]|uniref:glycine oxidase ThiO n=1 Tax=Streptomyces TaxID=1883 RepID=UPI001E3E6EA7|nr:MULTISPECIES: glycine oxidase ThiO [Streptomyces]UFQ19068.1 glycine oxidase ThiO [Streptomyces huasconensis]WCL88687.1 glycine oxidase ThiO [Streptomyces sp. JCM 35825]